MNWPKQNKKETGGGPRRLPQYCQLPDKNNRHNSRNIPHFSRYFSTFIYLFIYSAISRGAPNDILRRQSNPYVALIPTYRTIRFHNPWDHNPSRSFGFDSRPVHGGFVFDKVAMEQIYLRVLRFPPGPYHSTTAPYSNLIHLPPKLTSTM